MFFEKLFIFLGCQIYCPKMFIIFLYYLFNIWRVYLSFIIAISHLCFLFFHSSQPIMLVCFSILLIFSKNQLSALLIFSIVCLFYILLIFLLLFLLFPLFWFDLFFILSFLKVDTYNIDFKLFLFSKVFWYLDILI